jgi:hypothetical protein
VTCTLNSNLLHCELYHPDALLDNDVPEPPEKDLYIGFASDSLPKRGTRGIVLRDFDSVSEIEQQGNDYIAPCTTKPDFVRLPRAWLTPRSGQISPAATGSQALILTAISGSGRRHRGNS